MTKLTIVVAKNSAQMRTEEALAELERVQTQLLQRISKLEHSHLPSSSPSPNDAVHDSDTVGRLSSVLRTNGVHDFSFKRVPSDYYDWSLEARRDAVSAASVHHLCKSIVLVNTQAPANVVDCSDRKNSKYYVVVVQYTARFNADAVKSFLYSLNNGSIAKKKFNLRLAPEETSMELTGYGHNAVTCIGMKTDIPNIIDKEGKPRECRHTCSKWVEMTFMAWNDSLVAMLVLHDPGNVLQFSKKMNFEEVPVMSIFHVPLISFIYFQVILDEAIVKLTPDFFWLGGGEVDLKLGIRTSQLIKFVDPFIVNCSSN